MKIKPKQTDLVKVEFNIPNAYRETLKNYSEYTKYTPSEIIQKFIEEIVGDEDFIEYIKQKRYNKKALDMVSSIVIEERIITVEDLFKDEERELAYVKMCHETREEMHEETFEL